jgi:hypothetical protein
MTDPDPGGPKNIEIRIHNIVLLSQPDLQKRL